AGLRTDASGKGQHNLLLAPAAPQFFQRPLGILQASEPPCNPLAFVEDPFLSPFSGHPGVYPFLEACLIPAARSAPLQESKWRRALENRSGCCFIKYLA